MTTLHLKAQELHVKMKQVFFSFSILQLDFFVGLGGQWSAEHCQGASEGGPGDCGYDKNSMIIYIYSIVHMYVTFTSVFPFLLDTTCTFSQ